METKVILIYDANPCYECDTDVRAMRFETDKEAVEYINKQEIHEDNILGLYEYIREVRIEPVGIAKRYKIENESPRHNI